MNLRDNASSIRVVHSLPFWLPLTATWLYSQICHLPADVDNFIVCRRTENLNQFDIQNIFSLDAEPPLRRVWDRLARKRSAKRYSDHLERVAKKHGAAILHSHWGESAWRDVDVARRLGLPHVATFYGKDVSYYPRHHPKAGEHYEHLFRNVALVLCEGPYMASSIVKLGCSENKVLVHRLGVEVEHIAYRPRVWDGTSTLRVLIAASFREKKGIPYALQALGEMRRELPGLEITIIGDSSDDPRSQPEKEKILRILEGYDLRGCTRLLGYQSHAVFFQESYKSHIFISPSVTASDGDTEGGAPVSLIEMAATGIPIVSTTHCDIPNVIVDGRTGLLAPERNVEALVERLRWLVSHRNSWRELLDAGREHIEGQYDVERQSVRLAAVYRSLVAGGNSRR
jgi:colanic acid/amylovoran/stewartan biosynthesis glycosyltransferase WcaL/AmsK/CpsK